jgi:N-formylglutamate amidohydrolase
MFFILKGSKELVLTPEPEKVKSDFGSSLMVTTHSMGYDVRPSWAILSPNLNIGVLSLETVIHSTACVRAHSHAHTIALGIY